MMKRHLIYTLFILLMVSCSASHSLTRGLTHTWKMMQVSSDGNDVSQEHNPNNDRFIRFTEDGSFESGGTPTGTNTGKYMLNINEGTLFLDSDAGEDDDSKWNILIKGDEMTWTGIGSAWHEGFKITFKKASN